jgi:hypothetical protein
LFAYWQRLSKLKELHAAVSRRGRNTVRKISFLTVNTLKLQTAVGRCELQLSVAFRSGRRQSSRLVPATPFRRSGSESTVRIAKADLVPTEANLLPAYFEHLGVHRVEATMPERHLDHAPQP